MKTILPFFFSLLLICGCTEDSDQELTYKNFKSKLRKDITYHQMVMYFGKPVDDIGSGIHIYVYNLHDGTKMLIGFTEKVIYARHFSADDQLLHELILS
jgi:hypothetical protein